MKKQRGFLFSFLWHVSKLVYPHYFPATKFGTNDVYSFKTTTDKTLVIEAHVGFDDMAGGEQQFSIFQLWGAEAFSEKI